MAKQTTRRLCAMLLALVMVIGLMVSQVLAATPTSGKCGKKARWSYDKKTHTLTVSGKGTIKGTKVDDGFEESIWPTERFNLVIKKGITGISGSAFCDMDIRSLSLPSTLKTIGNNAFGFMDGTLPATITLPKSVEKIAPGAFFGCDGLKKIKVQKGNKKYTSVDGVLFNKDKTMLHTFPTGKHGSYKIPKGTKTLASGSFACVELKEMTIPASVKKFAKDKYDAGISYDTTIKTLLFQGKPPKGLLDELTYDDHGLWVNHIYYPKEYEKEWNNTKKKYLSMMNDGSADWEEDLVKWHSY